ncbi:winged helix-turn-helix transcriptional regulator [Mycobacterium sp. 663a-19]|uniref:helix-turn-helix transcriptional regulator n=1 Tax=Mycobacterium sp. 663a-19 TaxID=2986148 RepID=UPI002D1EDF0A|nr:helix-turn-helix domain-containing protein [Mycobacterium sp. 663a-19]MEB3980036.1 winged helix-turn-helix transcriptional regulator [Mycobacterium sp. 663a-19]
MDDQAEHQSGRPRRTGRNRQRQRVLDLVRAHDEPVDAAELATRLGLHTTTVRFHLDALCSEGVVERTRISRAGIGRPRTGYLAVRERLNYRVLAEILALELGDTNAKRRRRAEAAGRRWAERITAEAGGDGAEGQRFPNAAGAGETLEEQVATVATVFARMGFGPALAPDAMSRTANQRTIRLHSCPVRELARAHPEVGCALHQGLLQGLLANSAVTEGDSRPVMRAELEPFVEPELCLVRVKAHN